MAYQLWEGDDPMPPCQPCMNGHHDVCHEWVVTPPYGQHACGCTNAAHEEEPGEPSPCDCGRTDRPTLHAWEPPVCVDHPATDGVSS